MNILVKIVCFSLLLIVVTSTSAWARLSGSAAWGFVDYTQEGGGGSDIKASHFTQKYSILKEFKGLLSGGRLGSYNFNVGTQWVAFDSDIDGQSLSKDAWKILYKGHVNIAPGALPFRFNVYSYDLATMSFGMFDNRDGLLSQGIAKDISNGQTIVSGAQLVAGVRNGHYLGQYRELLSKFPRIFVDYRDYYREDLNALTPVKIRDSNLAFVSLNKKDNWFHYRMRTYKDFFNPEENTSQKSFMLGTVDHKFSRHWINMTNWIKLSIDGSFSVVEKEWNDDKTETFSINFFTTMKRNGFGLQSLMNMHRVRKSDKSLSQFLELPVFTTKSFDSQTDLRTTFKIWKREDEKPVWSEVHAEDSYYGKVLLKQNKRSKVQFDSSLEAEVATSYLGEGQALRGKVEAKTNPRMRSENSWYSMASLASYRNKEEDAIQTSLWEAELLGGGQVRLGPRTKVGGSQYFLYGTGSYSGTDLTYFMSAASGGGFGVVGSVDNQYREGTFYRSISEMYLEHVTKTGIKNRLEAKVEYEQGENKRRHNLRLAHRLDYRTRVWRFRLDNIYFEGVDTGSLNQTFSLVDNNRSTQWFYRQRGVVSYQPNIYWETKLSEELLWGEENGGRQSGAFSVSQSTKRTFYTPSGLRRKRGDIRQSLLYQQSLVDKGSRAAVFSLEGNYYPTRNWRLGTGVQYKYYASASNVIFYTLTAGMNFPKFKVDFNYRYGTYEDTDVVAHRYEVNVSKKF